jgi:hypothetical protein
MSPICAKFPAHLVVLYLIILTTFGEQIMLLLTVQFSPALSLLPEEHGTTASFQILAYSQFMMFSYFEGMKRCQLTERRITRSNQSAHEFTELFEVSSQKTPRRPLSSTRTPFFSLRPRTRFQSVKLWKCEPSLTEHDGSLIWTWRVTNTNVGRHPQHVQPTALSLLFLISTATRNCPHPP